MSNDERDRVREMDGALEGFLAAAHKVAAALERRRERGQGLTVDELALVKADKRYTKAWPEG